MNSGGLLRTVVEALEIANIRYMVVGSFASTYHSAPRMTRDIDFVVAASPKTIEVFVEQFDRDRFYVDDAVSAVRSTSMFNVIDTETGWKADLIVQGRSLDRAYLQRCATALDVDHILQDLENGMSATDT